jgi:hypothetical protein
MNNNRVVSPNPAGGLNGEKDPNYLSEPSMENLSPTKIMMKKDSVGTVSKHDGQTF